MTRAGVLWLLLAGAAWGDPVKVENYQAEGGFIDDPFAFSPDGKTLAYLTTDGATASQLHLVAPGTKEARVSHRWAGITPERVVFLDGERVLLIDRNDTTRMARGDLFTRQGPLRERFGPADGIALATVNGTPAIVTWLRAAKGPGAVHTFTAVRRDNLKPLAKRAWNEGANGKISVGGKNFKPLFFEEGYTVLVAQKEGEFDAARDIRRPDLEARVDVFGGKVLGEREIKEVIAWTQLAQVRAKHQNEPAFLQYADDLKHLQLVDGDEVVDLSAKTVRPLKKYDHTTLQYEPGAAAGELVFSLSVDPVNPDAVAAKKADQDWLDLYRLDVKGRVPSLVARFDGQKRPLSWHLGGGRIGLLRKHKGFSRGGVELEVWDLAPPPPPAGPPPGKK